MPAPFGPMSPRISPFSSRKREVSDGLEAAEPLRDVGELEEAHAASGAGEACGWRRARHSLNVPTIPFGK